MAKDRNNNNRNTGVQQPEVKDEIVQGAGQLDVVPNADAEVIEGGVKDDVTVEGNDQELTETKEPLEQTETTEKEEDKEDLTGNDEEDKEDLTGNDEEDPEDKPEEEEETDEPVALSEDDELIRIEKLIADIELDTDGTLAAIATSSILVFSVLASKLMDYRDQMDTSKGLMEVKTGAVKNGQLYRTIMNILSNKDERYFRIGFSLINIVFKTYNGEDEAYNKYVLTRYDSGWDNQKDLSTYNKLVTFIPRLADATTREEEKIKIDFDKLRDKVKTNFTDLIVDRLVAFYNV